jgi:glycosyltransferase involved in cell wall biosynthesis
MNGIALAYSGVHQMFQLALAAHELGELDGLFCSMVDGDGKWGGRLGSQAPASAVRPLGWESLPQTKLLEYPWPLLMNRVLKKYLPMRRTEHRWSNTWFDHAAARWLRSSQARVFIGAETCALASLRQAGEMGMKRVLDCPGIPASVLEREERRAAANFDVKVTLGANSTAMQERKKAEIREADLVLCCSEFQREQLGALHPAITRTEVIPLWADTNFWGAGSEEHRVSKPGEPLRVLCAGAVSLRKGVPYLLEAVEPLSKEVVLTLAGEIAPEMAGILKRYRTHRHLPYLPKQELRRLYLEHDVLVMPTLGDSFGFVLIEAMAAGLPVIASRHAGAPVPEDSWRVPPHDAEAIRAKLLAYHADREKLCHDGSVARNFASHFTPERYRARAGELFRELLAA